MPSFLVGYGKGRGRSESQGERTARVVILQGMPPSIAPRVLNSFKLDVLEKQYGQVYSE